MWRDCITPLRVTARRMEDDIGQMCSVNITDWNHPALKKGSATDDLCVTLSFLCNQSHPADQPQQVVSKEYKPHGLINYIDTKAKCRHLKNWPADGLCAGCFSEFIDRRHSESCWYFWPSFVNCCLSDLLSASIPPPLPCVNKYTVYNV